MSVVRVLTRRSARRRDGQPSGAHGFADGLSLREHVRRYGPLDEESLHRVAVATAESLASIHAAGGVHGDLRPDGITVGSDGARVVTVAPLQPQRETGWERGAGSVAGDGLERRAGAPAAGRSPDVRQRAGQARDVFGWAAAMAFAAGTTPSGSSGAGGAGGDLRAGVAGRWDLSDPMRALLRDCLGEEWQRPTAREMLYRLSGDLFGDPSGDLSGDPSGDPSADVWGDPSADLPGDPSGEGADDGGARPGPATGPDHPTVMISPGGPGEAPDGDEDADGESGHGDSGRGSGHRDTGPDRPHGRRTGRRPGHRVRAVALWLILLIAIAAAGTAGWRQLSGVLFHPARHAVPPVVDRAAAAAGAVTTPPTSAAAAPTSAASTPAPAPSAGTPRRAMPTTPGDPLNGAWAGTLTQSQSPKPLAVRVTLRGRNGGRIVLPDLGCTGALTVLDYQPDRAVYRDKLTKDPDMRCARSGTVTIMQADARTLVLSWVNNAAPYNSATGTLRKG